MIVIAALVITKICPELSLINSKDPFVRFEVPSFNVIGKGGTKVINFVFFRPVI